jgi:sugar transferase (PEP-CTERM system associated)
LLYKFFFLMAGDIILAFCALFTGLIIRFGYEAGKAEFFHKPFARAVLFVLVLVISSYIFEVYNLERHRNRREILSNILISVLTSFVVLPIFYFIIPPLIIGRGVLAFSLAVFVIYQFSWHVVFGIVHDHPSLAERILVVGAGESADRVGSLIHSVNNGFSHVLVGYVACESEPGYYSVPPELVIGTVDDLPSIAMREKVSQIVVSACERRQRIGMQNMLLNCKLMGVRVLDAPTFLEPMTGKLMLEEMDINRLIYADGFRRRPLYVAVKRVIDVALSFFGVILLLPFFPIIAVLVKLDSPGPVFFTQTRVGQWGQNFVLYKFRTMPHDIERETGAVWAQENDPRIRPIGRFLRKWRIDELPQLYNVLKGDMSFVGPRPERPEFVTELARQIPFYAKRHFIKPGITGWAQVKYPYGASVEDAYEKLRYDLYYFKNLSLTRDIIVILKTFRVVIFGSGR